LRGLPCQLALDGAGRGDHALLRLRRALHELRDEALDATPACPGAHEAGQLTQYLSRLSGHVLGLYPDVDMLALPYAGRTFDLVVHSDTLEHVRRPIDGLAECRRVLRPGGMCAFTVPIIVDRLTSSRDGMPPSYHGFADEEQFGFQVETEYGCDAWKHVALAGFQECRIQVLEYPAAQALVGVRDA